MSRVPVLVYLSKRPKAHVLDEIALAERRTCDTPFGLRPDLAHEIFEPAGVSPSAWRDHLVGRFGFDPALPDEAGIRRAFPNLSDNYVASELRKARENAEAWTAVAADPAAEGPWEADGDAPQVVGPEGIWDILCESLGKGLPFVAFAAEAEELRDALSDDNEITVAPGADGRGAMFGLHDAANGATSFVFAIAPVTFRPAVKGTVVLGDVDPLDVCQIDPSDLPETTTTHVAGEPLRYSSRSEDTMRFGAPDVDLGPLDRPGPTP